MDGELTAIELVLPVDWGIHPSKFPGTMSVTMDAQSMFFAQWLMEAWSKR